MLNFFPKTPVIFHDPEGGLYPGYVRSCGADGCNLTVFDPRYPDPAQKDDIPLDATGKTPGSFKLDVIEVRTEKIVLEPEPVNEAAPSEEAS